MPVRISEIIETLAATEDARRTLYEAFVEIFTMLDGRIAAVEGVAGGLIEIQSQLQESAQEIVDDALDPVRASLASKADLGAILTAASISEATVGTGLRSFVVSPESARTMFAPAHTLSIVASDNAGVAMYARRVSYDSDTGELVVDVLAAFGAGTLTSWTISPGSLATMATAITVAPEGGIAGPTLQLALGQIKALLDSKSDDGHGHTISDVDGLPEALSALTIEIDGIEITLAAFSTTLSAKANSNSPTFTGTVILPSTTSIGNVSATEIGYLDGVTSGIQAQLNAKAPIANPTFTGVATAPRMVLTNTTDAAPGSTTHALQIGPTDDYNLAISDMELQARSNGTATPLRLNEGGGGVYIGSASAWSICYSPLLANSSIFSASWDEATPNFSVNTLAGFGLYQAGSIYASRSGGHPLSLQRLNSGGAIAYFFQANTSVGSISVSGSATTYNTSSDERLKEDFQQIDADLIDLVNVYDFAWKEDGSRAHGVKAQELYQIIPTAVFCGEDPEVDMWSADYSKLVPLLIQAVKDLRQEVAALKAQAG